MDECKKIVAGSVAIAATSLTVYLTLNFIKGKDCLTINNCIESLSHLSDVMNDDERIMFMAICLKVNTVMNNLSSKKAYKFNAADRAMIKELKKEVQRFYDAILASRHNT